MCSAAAWWPSVREGSGFFFPGGSSCCPDEEFAAPARSGCGAASTAGLEFDAVCTGADAMESLSGARVQPHPHLAHNFQPLFFSSGLTASVRWAGRDQRGGGLLPAQGPYQGARGRCAWRCGVVRRTLARYKADEMFSGKALSRPPGQMRCARCRRRCSRP